MAKWDQFDLDSGFEDDRRTVPDAELEFKHKPVKIPLLHVTLVGPPGCGLEELGELDHLSAAAHSKRGVRERE